MSTSRLFHLDINSDMANLERVSDFILDVAKKTKLTEKQTDHVQMALDEAVTNVMEHAYEGRTDGAIFIRCRVDAKELTIEIRDQGAPFDAGSIQTPNTHSPLSERSIGGLGVFFMRKLMDRVEFARDDTGNVTRMTKKLK